MATTDLDDAVQERRLRRLREELDDEQVPLTVDGPSGDRLLAEVAYARRPLHHENHIPGYGALIFPGVPDWDACPQAPLLVPAPDVPPAVLRRYADGRSSFVVVTPDGLSGLATFEHSVEDEGAAVHSLASARVGATFVWNLDGCPPGDTRGGLVELGRAIDGPPLSVARRGHFPALLSVQAQVDLATVVAADGSVGPIGVRLDHSPRAAEIVPPTGGARHTSARRFTFDVPEVLAVVVSESGRVTVFSGGAIAAEITPDQPVHQHPGEAGVDPPPGDSHIVTCERCGQALLTLPANGSASHACPVCGADISASAHSLILGVPVRPRLSRSNTSDALHDGSV
jgi:predicted RNA-binding Zn-ribbon protein involved in translation (DUF1610 family)